MAKPPSTLVVPTDFSASSTDALEAAIDLAGRLGAQVDVVYVAPRRKPLFPRNPDNRQAVERLDQQEVDAARRKLADLAKRSPQVKTARVLRGVPHEEILSWAERRGADFIVIGSTGRHIAKSFLLGSTTMRVLQFSKIPVITIPSRVQRKG